MSGNHEYYILIIKIHKEKTMSDADEDIQIIDFTKEKTKKVKKEKKDKVSKIGKNYFYD